MAQKTTTTTVNHAQPQKARKKPQSEKGSKEGQTSSRNDSTSQQQDLHFEGPSIFKEVDTHAPAHELNTAPNVADNNNNNNNNNNNDDDDDEEEEEEEYGSVLAVPMLPGVSLEPIYRQQRSFSFSMGQDPEFFGYNDYEDDDDNNSIRQFKRSLETMAEEDETLLADEDVDLSRFRTRSKSSGAALAMLSTSQQSSLLQQFVHRGQDHDQTASDSDAENKSSSPVRDPVQQLAARIENMEINAGTPPYHPGSYPAHMPVTFPMHPHQEIYSPHHPPPPPPNAPSHPNAHPQGAAALPPSGFHPPPHPPPYLHRHPQSGASPEQTVESDSRAYHDMGKGVSLHKLPEGTPLYLVEFKAKRTDFFYLESQHGSKPKINDLVIVEADRGKDLGKVIKQDLNVDQLVALYIEKQKEQQHTDEHSGGSPRGGGTEGDHAEISKSDIHIKRIYRLALPEEIGLLAHKKEDEQRALAVCQQKTRQRKLPMEVVDAEFQWDRRKLTFYFMAERRIDFRELVRELFKIYKTRIWMCAVNTNKSSP